MTILTNTRAVVTGLAVSALALAGVAVGAAPADAASTSTWDRVAQCESGGNWHINTGNGYYGGLQFTLSTWHGYGGDGNPAAASKQTQIRIAERVLAGQGWGAWPVCSVKAGARGESSAVSAAHGSAHRASQHHSHVAVAKHRYVVRVGDTLGRIARAERVEGGWKRLWDANPSVSDPDVIRAGQHLRLPA